MKKIITPFSWISVDLLFNKLFKNNALAAKSQARSVTPNLFLDHFKSRSFKSPVLMLLMLAFSICTPNVQAQVNYRGVDLGNLPRYLFVFTDGSVDANWQSSSKGYVGDVAVDGIQAKERTSGKIAYSGTIYTNDNDLDAWQKIVDDNPGQASASYNQVSRVAALENDLESSFIRINSLAVTPGYSSVSAASLDGLNTQNGVAERYVINITSGFGVSSKINITGDAGDVFFFRWDTDANFADGYDGQVKFQSGGAFVPLGGLKPSNFVHVAGDISASGGGSNPNPPYPQGPRHNDGTGALITGGSDFNGGGFFTGYWLTTGAPTIFPGGGKQPYGKTHSLSNAIFVGGWYSKTTEFSMTSGTSGVYVKPPTEVVPVTWLNISATKTANGTIEINWATASEINNDFFTVERSSDSRNFVEIAKVKGAGNKNTISKYIYEDVTPANGTFYYRVKQTDFDGAFDYSAVVAANAGKLINNVTFNPNPASSNVTVTWDATIKEALTLNITDLKGSVIFSEPLSTTGNTHYLNVQNILNGIYLINMVSNDVVVYRSRIIITK